MRWVKQISVFLIVILFCQISASAANVGGSTVTSAGAIVIDFETGMELYAHNADVRHATASMSKMMSVYLVYEAIANGKIGYDTRVPISAHVASNSRNPGETNVPLSTAGTYYVGEMLDVVIVMSACAATDALAELVAGTRQAFYRLMNDKAAEWGIDAIFGSTYGGSTFTKFTPRAMAVITRNTILDFPEVLEKTSKQSVVFHGRTYWSTNGLLGVYDGIDGYKTGTNTVSRENFAATAKRGDTRIITVTMGSNYGRRFRDTTILLDYGFAVMGEHRSAGSEADKVPPSSSTVFVDGMETEFESYLIGGNNYFKIRDIAYALSGTPAQFNVEWDGPNNSILLASETPYTVIGGEMSGRSGERKLPVQSSAKLVLDGAEATLAAYNIEGSNYFRLRDVLQLFDVGVSYDPVTRNIRIDTAMPYSDD